MLQVAPYMLHDVSRARSVAPCQVSSVFENFDVFKPDLNAFKPAVEEVNKAAELVEDVNKSVGLVGSQACNGAALFPDFETEVISGLSSLL
eukprot:15475823-Alexandrium_andersonii.AAC.1